jgi:biotin carboxyl carrier protein
LIVARLERGRGPHRPVHVSDQRHDVVSYLQGADRVVEVGGTPSRVRGLRDGLVRALRPAIVMRFMVRPGDQVDTGDPLAVLETMKT